tara:strand:- start:5478 stop:5663 length:186 start_codon:yes stop_codon:yes gene_type:complete
MLKSINYKAVIGGLGSLGAAYLIAVGVAQQYIHFADPLNEMGTFICAIFLSVCSFMCVKNK